MGKTIFSATVFFKPGTLKPRKYKNVSNPNNLNRNMRNKGAYYINYYDQKSGEFKGRTWLQHFAPGN